LEKEKERRGKGSYPSMKPFIQYLIEENINKIRVVILTSRKKGGSSEDLYRTARVMKKLCEKKGIDCYTVFAEDGYIRREKGKVYIQNINDKNGFEISSLDTVILVRGSVGRLQSSLDLLSQLERNGIYCVNYRNTLESCSDKYRTALLLADNGIATPKTALVTSEKGLKIAFEKMGAKFPVVLKTLTGSKGIGVFISDSWEAMRSTLQTIWKINKDVEIVMQEYLDADYDIRVHVLGDEVIACMKRFKIEQDFRSNYSLGGKVEKMDLNDEEKEIAIQAAKAVGASWAGVDLMRNKKDGKLYVIEVNSSPGTEGIEKATQEPVVEKVVDFILDKKNWRRPTIEAGFIETVNIQGIGEIHAKLDTGNGSYCVLHADTMEIKDGKVDWTHDGKKFSNEIESMKKFIIGGVRNEKEVRPVIWLNITFNGETYEMRFALSDRNGMTTNCLLNRKFIRQANLTISPSKQHVLSIKKG
jgi:RimK family alpha-L-glutamate ligase